jgi:hypothetical protein
MTTFGSVRDVNTLGYVEGAPIFLSETVSGGYQQNRPLTGSAYAVVLGFVVRAHATEGVIVFEPTIVPRLDRLSGVEYADPLDRQIMQYNSTDSHYELVTNPDWKAGTETGFNSAGIDDDCTAERLQLFNTSMSIGNPTGSSDYAIHTPTDVTTLTVSGGSSATTGARAVFNGSNIGIASLNNSMLFYGADLALKYLSNTDTWNFQDKAITTTGVITGDGSGLTNLPAGSLALTDLTDVVDTFTGLTDGQVLTYDSTNGWQNETSAAGVTDHTLLSNIGTNTHAQIDTHLALTNAHIDWTADQGATNINAGNYTNTTYVNSDWNHDLLTGFVAAEHIDWSVTGVEDIHVDRLPAVADVTWNKNITVEEPDNAENITWFYTGDAITIDSLEFVLVGSATPSVTISLYHGTNRTTGTLIDTNTITNTTTGTTVTTITDATIPANSFVWVVTTAQSGTVDSMHITAEGTID